MRKRFLTWLITLALLGTLLPQVKPLVSAEPISGSCGDNLIWEYDSEHRVLIITGSGKMQNWYADNLVPWASYRGAIASVSLPQELTSIGEYAFMGCFSLKSITIPDGVVSIGNNAFANCSKLESINMPSSVSQIGDHAFWCCSSLSSVTIPEGLKIINSYMFANCPGLNKVEIPESVTKIDRNAFANCSNLVTITIPDSVISISNYAFINCTSLSDLTIGNSVTDIGYQAFYNCVSLLEITIPDSVTKISGSAFSNCKSLSSVTISESISVIPENVFKGCINLTEVTIPNSVTCIGWGAFSNCTSLTNVLIPSSVQSIESYAFADCTSLTDVTISYAVKRIDYRAFYNCIRLTNIIIPSSVTSIGENAFGFYGEYYSKDDDYKIIEFTISGYPDTAAMKYAEKYGFSFIAVEETRTGTCGDHLFWSFKTGSGLLTISGSGEMTDWSWSDDVPWYDYRNQITAVVLPDELTSIGSWAFDGCSALTNLTIPGGVTSIGWSAFYDCTNLKEFTVAENNPAYSNDEAGALFDKNKTTVVYFPCAFSGQYEIPNTVTTIGSYAFSPCPGLTDVVIPDSVKEIGDYAFYRCPSLTSVTIPSCVMRIEIGAFGILWDDEHFTEYNIDGFTILGYSYSVAQAYADNNGFEFIALDAEPCADGHTPGSTVRLNEVAATCTGIGSYDEAIYCIVCGAEISRITNELVALGHNYVNGVCTRCGTDDPSVHTDPCEGYTDIDRNSWYHTAADFVLECGLMGSTKTDKLTFEPTTACTRAMIAQMLYSLEGKPAVTFKDKFPDVKKGQWFTDAVMWAYQNGVVSGYDNGKFGPNDKVTREQMAVILKAYTEKVKGLNTSATTSLSGFADAGKVTWSKPFIQWAVAEGLLSGKAQNGKTYLDPQGNATRAEVAAIMRSFILNIIEAN